MKSSGNCFLNVIQYVILNISVLIVDTEVSLQNIKPLLN